MANILATSEIASVEVYACVLVGEGLKASQIVGAAAALVIVGVLLLPLRRTRARPK